MKCQKCSNAATLHITDVVAEEQIEEHHLCEVCAHKFLYEPQAKGGAKPPAIHASDDSDEPGLLNRECESCGTKFVDFRNLGRLGCPHDYEVFREELLPLLENIHGEVKHVGKVPRRLPQAQQAQQELVQLRKRLGQAVHKENYEEAARLRDQIRRLEEG